MSDFTSAQAKLVASCSTSPMVAFVATFVEVEAGLGFFGGERLDAAFVGVAAFLPAVTAGAVRRDIRLSSLSSSLSSSSYSSSSSSSASSSSLLLVSWSSYSL